VERQDVPSVGFAGNLHGLGHGARAGDVDWEMRAAGIGVPLYWVRTTTESTFCLRMVSERECSGDLRGLSMIIIKVHMRECGTE
jgi:hypothetical protein